MPKLEAKIKIPGVEDKIDASCYVVGSVVRVDFKRETPEKALVLFKKLTTMWLE